jgi:hypothetical protein
MIETTFNVISILFALGLAVAGVMVAIEDWHRIKRIQRQNNPPR